MARLGEYYAAALIHIARQSDNGISQPRIKIKEILESYWSLSVSEEDVSDAVRILNRCDISYVEDDEFAGVFLVITAERYQGFLDRVVADREEYNQIVKAAEDPSEGINRAEEAFLPYLSAYNDHKVLRKYSAFGADWLNSAIDEIRRRMSAGEVEIPASDRVVQLDHNSPKLEEIRVAASDLQSKLIKGNDLGDLTKEQALVAAEEVAQIAESLTKQSVRPTDVATRARSTLRWIGEKAAGTLVGQAATVLFKLIMQFLGISL